MAGMTLMGSASRARPGLVETLVKDGMAQFWARIARVIAPGGDRRTAVDFVAGYHSSVIAMLVETLAAVGLCGGIARLSGDLIISVAAGLICMLVLLRTIAGIHFHRLLVRDRQDISRRWELTYELTAWSCAALFGFLALAALLRSADPAVHMLSIALAARYAGGISGRNAGRVATVIGQSALVLGPASIGLWLVGGTEYRVLAIAMTFMMFGMAEIGATTHRIVAQALRGQREKAQLAAKYERLARYDSLTGVENRMAMQMRLRDIFESNRKRQDAVAILWMDLDRFKEINDSLGHIIGDNLLRIVAEKLAEALDGRGHVARFGGDEFVLICPGADRETARGIAVDVMDHFQHSFDLPGHSLTVTASIGIAIAPQDGGDVDELMRHADVALYQAKREGRNRAVSFTWSMKERSNRRHEVENGLRRAIDNGELALHYQPIFDLATGRITTCEALMRWTHPTLGRIPPAEFIPVAEAIGVIEPLSLWALREACATAAAWPNEVRVAVNISPASLTSGEMPRAIIATLLETGLPARRLELEVTESVFLEDNRHTHQMLRELQLIGLKLVLDDFGIGYSSLSYLRSYRFDMIKVDQSFMAGISESREDQAVVQAVGHIARALDMGTVAEGIENQAQLRQARAAGFNSGQGFLLCPPQTRDRINEILESGEGMTPDLMAAPVIRRRRA